MTFDFFTTGYARGFRDGVDLVIQHLGAIEIKMVELEFKNEELTKNLETYKKLTELKFGKIENDNNK